MKKINFHIDFYRVIILSCFFSVIAGDFILLIGYCYSFLSVVFHPRTFLEYLACGFVRTALVFQILILISIPFSYIPMPNKKIIKIAHFFGFMKDKEPISAVTVNISSLFYTAKENELIQFQEIPDYLADNIKEKIYSLLKKDPGLESRCRRVFQVWVTFYEDLTEESKRHGSIMHMCYYREGVLYYPCKTDRVLWKEKKEQWDIEDQNKK